MNPLTKTIVNAILAGLIGGTVPAVNGNSWTEILITGGVAVIIALINLWQHKPGTERVY